MQALPLPGGQPPPFEQDPQVPPGWFVWDVHDGQGKQLWWVRPPIAEGARIDPSTYVSGDTKEEAALKAWEVHANRYRNDSHP